jgi:hypothetical protein
LALRSSVMRGCMLSVVCVAGCIHTGSSADVAPIPAAYRRAITECLGKDSSAVPVGVSLADLEGEFQVYAWNRQGLEGGDVVGGRLVFHAPTTADSARLCPGGIDCGRWAEAGTNLPMLALGPVSYFESPWPFDPTLNGLDVELGANSSFLAILGLGSHSGVFFTGRVRSRDAVAGTWHSAFRYGSKGPAKGHFCAQRVRSSR